MIFRMWKRDFSEFLTDPTWGDWLPAFQSAVQAVLDLLALDLEGCIVCPAGGVAIEALANISNETCDFMFSFRFLLSLPARGKRVASQN